MSITQVEYQVFSKPRESGIFPAQAGALDKDANLYAVMKKADTESEFRAPIQGFYAGAVNEEMVKAWFNLR